MIGLRRWLLALILGSGAYLALTATARGLPYNLSITIDNQSFACSGEVPESVKTVYLATSTYVEGDLKSSTVMWWLDLDYSRYVEFTGGYGYDSLELGFRSAGPGISVETEVTVNEEFTARVRVEELSVTAMNASSSVMFWGLRARFREEYRNYAQKSAVGIEANGSQLTLGDQRADGHRRQSVWGDHHTN